jgi:hypothetical protein
MITSQRKKRRNEKEKGRNKKDKESKTKKIKGDGAVVGGRAYPLLASFKLFFFFFSQTYFPPHFGNTSPNKVQIPKQCYEQFLKKIKYLAISCLSKNSSVKHKLQH